MWLEMENGPAEVEQICERIRRHAADHPLPRKELDIRSFCKAVSDHAFLELLTAAIESYRGNLFDVAFCLGISESGVYQAVRRFGLWDTVARSRDGGPGEHWNVLNPRELASQKIY